MKRKVTIIITFFLFLFLLGGEAFADGKRPPSPSSKKGNFSKGNFSKKNAWSNNGKAIGPPDPGGGGTGGNPIPISNGLTFLIIGSVLYLSKRVNDEKSN